ncbi:autotransporter domain-containing protein [Comamonas sp. CMM03]|uniref:autotransporter domain-containing protein n=1 Tax=Comamonas sp. CMM03 TaxID=2854781 RepID=UPI001C486EE2|nr:autotransporter domain-containing protein [Comamonas sp. CMM03]MBV7417462.1 autotransporter domain-containing protein [Comamonas sp. CMM03]
MNQIYRVVFNAVTGAWQATSETARGRSKSSRSTKRQRRSVMASHAMGLLLLTGVVGSNTAWAACTPGAPTNGVTVTCTGNDQQNFGSAASNLNFNIATGSILSSSGSGDPVLQLTGSNYTINNSGQIYPSNSGQQSQLTTGLKVGNSSAQNIAITNNAIGWISGTSANLGASIANLNGMALDVQAGSGGKVTLVNYGTIFADAITGANLEVADMPNVAVYGGAQVEMTNTNQLYGRVAFQASNEGNIFTNTGTLAGSLSMGAGGGNNRFNALTGSVVLNGGATGTGSVTVDTNPNLVFVRPGVVDGGAGGSNTLALQNDIGGGSGTAGSGSISASSYINFSNLLVQAGTWQVSGALLTGATTSTSLTGGSLSVNNDAVFGSGDVSISGANLTTHTATVNLANNFLIGSGGMALSGTNTIVLNGVISGAGAGRLTKNNGGILRINGVNTYAGGTALNGGTTVVSTDQAFGTGNIAIGASGARIDASGTVNLVNDISLSANGTFGGTGNLTLSGVVSNTTSRTLAKVGSGQLTLANANTYQGGTTLSGGTLVVGNSQALGSGSLTVASASTLASSQAVTLSNQVSLASNLTVAGANDLRLNGVIDSTGAFKLIKTGSGNLTLAAANTFSDGIDLNSGTLTLATNSGVLGSGTLTVTGNSRLAFDAPLNTSTPIVINSGATLDLAVNQDLLLFNGISGGGNLTKTGTAEATLFQTGTLGGQVDVQAGKLTAMASNALGSGTPVNIASGATLSLGADTALGALTGSGQLQVTSGAISLGNGNASSTFSGAITGSTLSGISKVGSGTLTLAGINTFTSNLVVSAGRLHLNSGASLASSQVTVANGASLGGSGSLSGHVTVTSGATLAPGASNGTGSLTVGSLDMAQGSTLAVALGAPGANFQTPGQGTSVSVTGNLTLNGMTLSMTDAGGFGPGLYRLFDYGGTLTTSNGGFAAIPTSATIQFLTADKKINLINTQGFTLNLWNANGQATSATMGGGSGTWSNTAAAWTDATASITAAMSPQPGFAIFGGASGTVTVDSAAGAVKAIGLQFASDGYRLNGDALTLVADAGHAVPVEVRVGDGSGPSSTWTATMDNVLAGTDGLKKTGAGTLVLNGSNTYSGGTTVAAGTLSVSSDSNLGHSSGALTLDGGTVRITGTAFVDNGGRSWVLGSTGGGIDIADAANSFTLSGALTGAGNLLKTGAGTLTLNGTNNYGGTTTIDGGKLVASVTNLGSGAITNNAALELNQASDATLTQTISGNGSFTKTGAGTLTLAGANTATGETIISAGGLVASVANLASGAITNNAVLELKQASDATLAQKISGSGSLTKTGAGVLTLTGNSSNYTGSTLVANGGLLLGSTGKLGGTVTVTSSATLAGTGNVGSTGSVVTVQSGATIAAGDASSAYGTLRIAGDLVLEQGASYQVLADPNSSASSLIKVAGKATLAGSVLHVGNESNATTDFQVGKTYSILQASQIEGAFGSAISNFAYLDTGLGYSANEVTLQLQRKSSGGGNGGTGGNGGGQMEFADLAETRNQSSAANAISSLPSSHALYHFVETLPAGTPAAVFNSLSGDTHATVGGSLVGLGAYAPSVSGQHLRNNMTAGLRPGAAVAQSDGPLPASAWPSTKALPAWAEVVGHWQRYDGDGNAAQLKQRTTGLFLGMDEEVGTSGWRLGGSLGYTNASGKVADRSSESDVNSYSAAVYGGKSFGTGTGPRINVLGGLAYTWHDIETTRRVTSLGQTLKADYSAHTAQLFAEVGYAIGQYDKVGFEPFAGVSLGQQRTGSFQEHGGFAALQGRSSTDDLASTTLGVRVHSDFQLAGKEGRLRATVGWRHAFGDVTAKKTMAFEGSQNFTVAGTPLARNTAVLGLEADVALSRTAALVLGYQGEMGSGQRDHSASVKLRWAF